LDDGTGEGDTTSFDFLYYCLVYLTSPLGDPFTPFSPIYRGRGASADADVAILYSAASLMSIPNVVCAITWHLPVPALTPLSPPNNRRLVNPLHSGFSLSISALRTGGAGNGGAGTGVAGGSSIGPLHAAFESREIVAEAQLLLPAPDFVLVGGPALVRATLLRNHVDALTVDTVGVVAVGDIVRAVCIGQFSREDILLAANANNNRGSSGGGRAGSGGGVASHHEDEGLSVFCGPCKALDVVRERIDSEASVVP
jgi:WD repeat-containing protein 48